MVNEEPMAARQGPPVLRRILASELRRLRQRKGVTQQEAEKAAGLGQSALSRYESCVSSMQVPAAEKLLRYYGVRGQRLDILLRMVRNSRRRGMTVDRSESVWPPLQNLIALERDASSIQETAIRELPGLVQTEDYARAILQGGIVGEDVEHHVRARMERTTVFASEKPDYWLVACESALRCAIGSAKIMQAQLQHLLDLAEQKTFSLQVLPDSYGAHVAMLNPFKILRFTVAPDYAVIYMDYLTGSRYIDDAPEVDQYSRAYVHLIEAALPERQSLNLVKRTMKELYR